MQHSFSTDPSCGPDSRACIGIDSILAARLMTAKRIGNRGALRGAGFAAATISSYAEADIVTGL